MMPQGRAFPPNTATPARAAVGGPRPNRPAGLPSQLRPHRHLSELRPGPGQLSFGRVPAPSLQTLLAGLQEHPSPFFQLRGRHLDLPAHLAQVLATQKPQEELRSGAVADLSAVSRLVFASHDGNRREVIALI